MRLPMRTFWLLNQNINRLRAEEDLRSLTTAAASQSSEFAEEHRQSLILEVGEPTKGSSPLEAKRDEEGVAELKRIAQMWKR